MPHAVAHPGTQARVDSRQIHERHFHERLPQRRTGNAHGIHWEADGRCVFIGSPVRTRLLGGEAKAGTEYHLRCEVDDVSWI